MQNQQAAQSGKLEHLKSIGALLPEISALVKRSASVRGNLDAIFKNLQQATRTAEKQQADAERSASKQKEYEDYRAKLQKEREDAERKVDERGGFTKTSAPKPTTPAATPAKQTGFTQRPITQTTTAQGGRPAQSFGGPRPQGGFSPRPQGQGGFGQRPGFPPREGREFGPRPQGGGGYQGGQRPAFGPRPQGQGYQGGQGNFGPRPPRPAGAGGGLPRTSAPTEKFVPKVDTFSAKKRVKTFDPSERSGSLDKRALLRRGMLEEQEIEERMLTRMFRTKKAKEGNDTPRVQSNIVVINTNDVTVKTLSEKIGKPVTEIIKQLMVLGNMSTINSTIDFDTASLVAGEFGLELQLNADKTFEEKMRDKHKQSKDEDAGKMEHRPAVVTIMGHVDHGKTTLLDTIRKTNVTAKEHGGITQHIAAYQVTHQKKKITFVDTPGHAAFEKMRARGASLTDIAILIVAGDDGVMPQTIEAIKHIQKHKLPMIVAVNKMDKKEFNLDRVKEQLSTHNVLAEDWGGEAIMVPVSAMAGTGIDKLLETILLVAEINNYTANPDKGAQGIVIDGRKDAGVGGVVTLLVQSGTLKIGDTILAGTASGKVRKMMDSNGKPMKTATPGTPVQVLGFSDVPKAGDACYVVDASLTRQVVLERKDKERRAQTKASTKLASDIDAIASLDTKAKKQLNVILKGDVTGSLEAIIQTLNTITSDEVNVNVISSGVGVVNDNDVSLAEVSEALIIAFNVKTSPTAKILAKKQKQQIHEFNVIYQIFDFVTEKMVRMFAPQYKEVYFGSAEVRAVFKSSAIGLIAGCMVKDGKVTRGEKVKLVRGKDTVGECRIETLKIKKDDTKEVASGFECGIKLDGTVEIKVGDVIQCIGSERLPVMYNGKKYEF
ncbi:MAG: translation initiation factor IF-2 [Firmicutes bacterium]|nr:translation initiation factor IF-2 [Bacillota bacterium]